jgi:hypothetical protein
MVRRPRALAIRDRAVMITAMRQGDVRVAVEVHRAGVCIPVRPALVAVPAAATASGR